MTIYRLRIFIFLFFILWITACNQNQTIVQTVVAKTSMIKNSNTAISSISPTEISQQATITYSYNTPTAINSTPQYVKTSTTTPTQEPTLIVNSECPSKTSKESAPLLKDGTIIFSFRGPYSPEGIWANNSKNSAPFILTKGLKDTIPTDVLISPDKSQLVWIDALAEPRVLILYNLRTKEKYYLPAESNWGIPVNWQADGKIKIETREAETQTIGLKYNYDLFDPITKQITETIEYFDLPGLQINRKMPWYGYASINPSKDEVFYTALDGLGTDFVLFDTQNNVEIWRYKTSSFQGNNPIASWTSDGQNIAFVVEDKASNLQHLFKLNINTLKLSELTIMGDVIPYDIIRQLNWSPDNQYLLFSKFLLDRNKGPGFIIDTKNHQQKEICEEGYVFGKGNWIENTDLLLYTMYSETDTKLELLDVSTWQSQDLMKLNADNFVNYIGWTPIIPP